MESTSSPDNSRSMRGLSRFWPVHREADGEEQATDPPEMSVALPGETQMVALGSRRGDAESGPILPTGVPSHSPYASAARGPAGPSNPSDGPKPLGPTAPSAATPLPGPPAASGGPASPPGSPAAPLSGGLHEAPEGDSDHSGASEPEKQAAQPVESSRTSPWDRDPGTVGGFGLGGRNGRFLFGGRTLADEPQGRNGHAGPELNGRPKQPDGVPSTVDRPTVDHPAPADAGRADPIDENGRDEMNGRAGAPGFPAAADSGNNRRDEADAAATEPAEPAAEPRRQATGWASVPTSKHPVISPTSGAPTSGAPSPGAPASTGLTGGAYGQPPSYVPALPDPAAGPVSGVPAPRASAGLSALGDAPVEPAEEPRPAPPVAAAATTTGPASAEAERGGALRREGLRGEGLRGEALRGEASRGEASRAEALRAEALRAEASRAEPVRAPEEGGRRAWDDDAAPRPPAPRRSASLEDAEPARRGRRAAPDDDEDDDQPKDEQARPGDVAAGHIAFWDDDATRHFRAAWHEVKAEFVDDPVRALTRAHDLLTDAVNELTEALLAERDELDPLRGTSTPDTESMRMAMRGYREFLDRILAL